MSDWRNPWVYRIICRDCGAAWDVHAVDHSVASIHGFDRLVMFSVPEVCEECKNLRLVTGKPETPPPVESEEPSSA